MAAAELQSDRVCATAAPHEMEGVEPSSQVDNLSDEWHSTRLKAGIKKESLTCHSSAELRRAAAGAPMRLRAAESRTDQW